MYLEEIPVGPSKAPVRDLVAEANHRIANSLTSIAALVQREFTNVDGDVSMNGADAIRVLREVKARIDAVARLHRMLSEISSDSPVDVGSYLQRISSEAIATLAPPGAATLHFVCELGCRVAPERALYVGLIVVELVTNSLKYAHPAGVHGQIAIRCHRQLDAVVIEVCDDGVGFPEGFAPDDEHASGLSLVRSLARQIDGRVTFASDDLGVSCTLEVPTLMVA